MHVSVVGGGVAGALLAWRLAQQPGVDRVTIAPGAARRQDATAASGGAVRGFEIEAVQRRLAIDSLGELLADDRLRDWAGYTETGSLYRPRDTASIEAGAAEVSAARPDSVRLLTGAELRERGWAGDDLDGSAVVAVEERQAGYLDPERLRSRVLADLAQRGTVEVLADGAVTGLAPGSFTLVGAGHPAGTVHTSDILVLATGAWTPALLRAYGWDGAGLRTKAIQYTIFGINGWRPGTFVDEVSGLYGKPAGTGQLLGLPTQAWDVEPGGPELGGPEPDSALSDAVFELAQSRFPELRLVAGAQPVAALDCYSTDSLLALRPVAGTDDRVLTFTGGSGGAAKTVLAASARAATQLASGAAPHQT
ncbi:FAD-dependent oxidoreductase [Jatrophihabitans sp.]|jgi:glycine/D-amino acid oxidase-like deaminating enzyme|uniref:FAD-dependent oxidoreductase n=1 Tax=Jatrophihabitans sp. TaxID=1932789 RepID=UPI002F162D30